MDIVDDISVEKVKPTAAEDAAPADPFADIPDDLSPGEVMALLALRGLAVFPCEPDSKAPAIRRGFLNASTKVRLIADGAWVHYTTADGERGYSFLVDECNLAFEPGRAYLFVVDIDPKNGGDETWAELEARHGPVSTREVRTPSGGRHLWFRGTVPQVNKKLGPGIDTRCFGGYVLLPPSRVKGRTYSWIDDTIPIAPLPTWIVEEIEAADARESEILNEFRHAYGDGHEGDAFESWLALIGDHEDGLGFYDPMLRAVGTGVALGMAADAILDRLREAALSADRHTHSLAEIQDRLSKMPGAIRSFQAKDAQRQRNAAEEVAEEGLEELYEADDEFEELLAAQQAEQVAEEQGPFSDAEPADDGADHPSDAPAEEPDTASAAKDTTDKAASEWLSPEEAIASLRKHIRAWIERDRSHKKTLTCLQSPAGLGKTRTMLEEQRRALRTARRHAEAEAACDLAQQNRRVTDLWNRYLAEIPRNNPPKLRQIRDELEEQQRRLTDMLMEEDLSELPPPPPGKFACATPRQELADEIQEVDREQREADREEGKIPILRGRNASNCRRYDVVAKAQKKGFDPSACCHSFLPSGEEVFCPHFEKCSTDPTQYLANQAEVKNADNILLMHKHLTYPWLPSLALKSRKRGWIDENPCDAFKIYDEYSEEYFHDLVVTERDFAELGRRSGDHQALKRLAELSNALLAGLVPPGQLRIEQHLKGWSPAALREAGRTREDLEDWRRGGLDPSLGDRVLSQQIDTIEMAPRKLAALFYRLADEVEARGEGEIYSLGRNPRTGKIVMRGLVPSDSLPPNLLITDATLSPEILKAVFPGYALELVKIPVRRNAFITQTSEPVFSRNWLLNQGHLPEVVGWLKRLAPCYRNLVVLTTKRIRCAITGEDHEDKLPVFFEIHGARIGHYGNIRGSNKFADCDALVILGREQPPPEDMEEIAKAYWYATKKRLRLLKAINGHKHYRKTTRAYLMRDGSKERGEVMVHPDPRVQAVLTTVRENELIQAIDRARLIWGEPKDIYLLCDVSLLGVEIDRLVSWDVLRGNTRLNQALEASLARGENALPLAPKWLSEHFNEQWSTPKAAERWVESSPDVLDITRNPRFLNKRYILGGWGFLEIAIIEYLPNQRQPGHNRWSRALVWGDIAPGASLARALGLKETEFRWRPV